MSFAWQGFLLVARELTEPREHTAPLDARERAAIGRAYYAVFGRALTLFTGFGEYTASKRGDDHDGGCAPVKGGGDPLGDQADDAGPTRVRQHHQRPGDQREFWRSAHPHGCRAEFR